MARGVDFRTGLSDSGFGAYFNSLGCSLVSVSGNTITIGGRLSFYTNSGYQVIAKWDNTQLFSLSCNFPHSVEVYYSDDVFYAQGSDPSGRRWLVFYEKIGNSVLYGYRYSSSTSTSRFAFNDTTLTDADLGSTYTHGVMMNHTCDVGYIDYIDFTGLFNSGYKKKNDSNFLACSTITQGITVTIAGKNYYSVSANDLFPLD